MQHHILMYHHVAEIHGREGLAPYIVTPALFRKQLDQIEASGHSICTLAHLVNRVESQRTAVRSIVLTFDDCSRELWDFAIPELDARGLKATFFAVSGLPVRENSWDDHRRSRRIELMTDDELRTLSGMGHEIGSHCRTHRRLTDLTPDEVRVEIGQSRCELADVIGSAVDTLAYPFGAVPNSYANICREAGYKAACSIFSPAKSTLSDRFSIRRTIIHERDFGLRLRMKLSLPYLWLRAMRDR
jgi:peptidoglycan/xylan/chitin deacetylase (PgdA/CDA1 family)